MTATHRIRRLHLDVDFNGPEPDGMAFHAGLSDWCQQWLSAALEQALTRYAPEADVYWVLDRLDLQLDAIDLENTDEQLPKRLHSALETALRESDLPLRNQGNVPGSQMKTSPRHTWEAFCHFLRTGHLPWAFRPGAGQTLEQMAIKVWRDQNNRVMAISELSETLKTPAARQRLVRQYSPDWVAELAGALAPNQTATVRQIIHLFRQESTSGRALDSVERRLWETILFLGATAHDVYSVSGIVQEMWRSTLSGEAELLLRDVAHRLAQASATSPESGMIRRAVQYALEFLTSGDLDKKSNGKKSDYSYSTQGHKDSEADDLNSPSLRSSAEDNLSLPYSNQAQEQTTQGYKDTETDDLNSPSRPASAEDDLSHPYSNQAHEPATEQPAGRTSYSDWSMEENGIYLDNAGLALLHPFLPLFFEATGVSDGTVITDPDKALALLHFLVSGETTAPEHDLVLPKILCGLAPNAVAGPAAPLTEKDIEESINLLETAIGYWEALKNTSPEGLRNTFLQRPGKISRRENDWLLQVERQSFDVLLDTLPWGMSVVQLPWMDGLMWVEW